MQKRALAAIPLVPAMAAGFALVRFHLIAPSPGAFFALGAMAALCVVAAIAFGRAAVRDARAGQPVGTDRGT